MGYIDNVVGLGAPQYRQKARGMPPPGEARWGHHTSCSASAVQTTMPAADSNTDTQRAYYMTNGAFTAVAAPHSARSSRRAGHLCRARETRALGAHRGLQCAVQIFRRSDAVP